MEIDLHAIKNVIQWRLFPSSFRSMPPVYRRRQGGEWGGSLGERRDLLQRSPGRSPGEERIW